MSTPTPEAIEAAARAMYEDFRLDHNGRYANTPSWDKLGTTEQDHWRRHARVAVPFIAAQAKAEALREAADEIRANQYDDLDPFYADYLVSRANRIEGKDS